jgi:hypothetical protein
VVVDDVLDDETHVDDDHASVDSDGAEVRGHLVYIIYVFIYMRHSTCHHQPLQPLMTLHRIPRP